MSSFKQKVAAQRKQIAEKNAGYLRAYKFKPGKTQIKVLPGLKSPEDFFKAYGAHYVKDWRTGEIAAVVGDAELTYGTPCPVRSAIRELMKIAAERGNEPLQNSAKEMLAKQTYVYAAQILGGVDSENLNKVVLIEQTSAGFDSVLGIAEQLSEDDPDFDMMNGFIINVERTGTGAKDTRYNFIPSTKQPTSKIADDVLSQRPDLDAYVGAKFGVNVQKALLYLGNLLGKDLVGAHTLETSESATALPAPETASKTTAASVKEASPIDDDLASLAGATDAEFEDATPPFDTDAPSASTDVSDADDILSVLNDL